MKGGARLLYAITGHGFGHATRSAAVIHALLGRDPDLEVILSTSVPAAALEQIGMPLAARERLRSRPYEPGTAQRNCFEVDVEATRELYRRATRERPAEIEREAAWLAAHAIDGVIADAAALPIAAAARAGIPAIIASNFTWDWILEPLLAGDAELESFGAALAREYGGAARYLRLPFHGGASPLAAVEDMPLVGRAPRRAPEETRAILGVAARDSRPLVVVAIGGWDAAGWSPIVVRGAAAFRFVIVGDLPVEIPGAEVVRLPFDLGRELTFPDLVCTADVGIVKPGYGTCSEFVLAGTPMAAIERRGFREYEWLLRGMDGALPYRDVGLEDFFRGAWIEALEGLATAARPAPRESRADVVAERALAALGLDRRA